MWVIPKNLRIYPSALDTEALISDSEELSDLLEQSVLWRSKPSASKTWSRRLKVGGSTPRLFSQTLKPSHGESLLDEWISSVEGSLVNHSQQPEDEPETKTQDTSGLTLFEEFESWKNLPLFSSKMSRESSAQNSSPTDGQTQKEQVFCTMSLESWKDWVTERRQEYSVRVKSAHPIKESVSLFWVAAPISGSRDALLFQDCLKGGETQMWGTPTHGAAKAPYGSAPGDAMRMCRLQNQVQPTPHQEVRIWPTPTTQEIHHKDIRLTKTGRRKAKGQGGSHSLNLADSVSMSESRASTPHQETQMWVTPRADMSKAPFGGGDPTNKRYLTRLENQVRPAPHQETQMWNTPAARDYKGVDWNREARGYNPSLPNQAVLSTPHREAQSSTLGNPQESQWATPNTMDHLPQKSKEALIRQATTVRKGRTAPSNLREQVNPEAMEIYKQASQWATPQARDYKGSNRRTPEQSQVFGASLPMQMETETKGWATPTARDFEGAYRGAALVRKDGKLRTDTISTQVTLDWTTPISRDCYEISMGHPIPNRKDGKTRMDTMPRQVHHQEQYKGRLNPRWVETLMGLPVGWVMPSCANPWIITQMSLDCSETE